MTITLHSNITSHGCIVLYNYITLYVLLYCTVCLSYYTI